MHRILLAIKSYLIMNAKKSFLIIGATLLSICSKAQVIVSQSLDQAIRSGLKKNETLKQKEIEQEKLALERKDVLQKYIPRVEASGAYLYADSNTKMELGTQHLPLLKLPLFNTIFNTTKHSESYGNVMMGGVTAKMVLFSGLQIPYGAKALESKRIGTEYLGKIVADELIQEIVTSFDQIKVLEAIQKLIDDSTKRLENEAKRVEKGIEQGLAIPFDRDKIKLAQLELASKQAELDGNKSLIYKKINYLTGLDSAQIESVVNDFEPFIMIDNTNLSIENKHEIKALQSFIEAQEWLLKKEKGSFLPQMMAMGGVRYTSLFDANLDLGMSPLTKKHIHIGVNEITFSPTWFVGVGVKWELFGGMSRINKIKQTKLDIATTKSKLTDAHDKLSLLLDKNMVNYRIANEKMHINQQKVVVAKNSLDTAIRQYTEGLIDISDRLEVENEYYKVVIEQIQGIQQQRQAAMEMLKTTGTLSNYSVQ